MPFPSKFLKGKSTKSNENSINSIQASSSSSTTATTNRSLDESKQKKFSTNFKNLFDRSSKNLLKGRSSKCLNEPCTECPSSMESHHHHHHQNDNSPTLQNQELSQSFNGANSHNLFDKTLMNVNNDRNNGHSTEYIHTNYRPIVDSMALDYSNNNNNNNTNDRRRNFSTGAAEGILEPILPNLPILVDNNNSSSNRLCFTPPNSTEEVNTLTESNDVSTTDLNSQISTKSLITINSNNSNMDNTNNASTSTTTTTTTTSASVTTTATVVASFTNQLYLTDKNYPGAQLEDTSSDNQSEEIVEDDYEDPLRNNGRPTLDFIGSLLLLNDSQQQKEFSVYSSPCMNNDDNDIMRINKSVTDIINNEDKSESFNGHINIMDQRQESSETLLLHNNNNNNNNDDDQSKECVDESLTPTVVSRSDDKLSPSAAVHMQSTFLDNSLISPLSAAAAVPSLLSPAVVGDEEAERVEGAGGGGGMNNYLNDVNGEDMNDNDVNLYDEAWDVKMNRRLGLPLRSLHPTVASSTTSSPRPAAVDHHANLFDQQQQQQSSSSSLLSPTKQTPTTASDLHILSQVKLSHSFTSGTNRHNNNQLLSPKGNIFNSPNSTTTTNSPSSLVSTANSTPPHPHHPPPPTLYPPSSTAAAAAVAVSPGGQSSQKSDYDYAYNQTWQHTKQMNLSLSLSPIRPPSQPPGVGICGGDHHHFDSVSASSCLQCHASMQQMPYMDQQTTAGSALDGVIPCARPLSPLCTTCSQPHQPAGQTGAFICVPPPPPVLSSKSPSLPLSSSLSLSSSSASQQQSTPTPPPPCIPRRVEGASLNNTPGVNNKASLAAVAPPPPRTTSSATPTTTTTNRSPWFIGGSSPSFYSLDPLRGYIESDSLNDAVTSFTSKSSVEQQVACDDNHEQLDTHAWFHSSITRIQAETILQTCLDGSFLVRNSGSFPHEYSLSIKCGNNFLHMRISVNASGNYVIGEHSQPFSSVPAMIHHYQSNPLPIKDACSLLLLTPVNHNNNTSNQRSQRI